MNLVPQQIYMNIRMQAPWNNREFEQPRRHQQERHKFAYLKMKISSLARFARAFFIFVPFADVYVLYTT